MQATVKQGTDIFETHSAGWNQVEIRYDYTEDRTHIDGVITHYFACTSDFNSGIIYTTVSFTIAALSAFAEGLSDIYHVKAERTSLHSTCDAVKIECSRDKLGHLLWHVNMNLGREGRIKFTLENDLTYLPPSLISLSEFLSNYTTEYPDVFNVWSSLS